jgi:hypothetical protein
MSERAAESIDALPVEISHRDARINTRTCGNRSVRERGKSLVTCKFSGAGGSESMLGLRPTACCKLVFEVFGTDDGHFDKEQFA